MNDSPGRTPPGASPDRDDPEQEGGAPAPNWSAHQPPSSGSPWGAPPPAQRPAGNGGWNAGGWNAPPPAPRPGVVPLRPLAVGELLGGALATLRLHWRSFLGISLGIGVLLQALSIAVGFVRPPDTEALKTLENDSTPEPGVLLDLLRSSLPGQIVDFAAQQLALVAITALLVFVVSRAVLGRTSSAGEAFRDARPRILPLLGLLLLVVLIAMAVAFAGFLPGMALLSTGPEGPGATLLLLGGLAGTATALWLWIRLSLAAPALMLEKQTVVTALRRSAKLVRNSWWRVLGITLLAQVLALALASLLQIPASALATALSGTADSAASLTVPSADNWAYTLVSGVGQVLAYAVTLPFVTAVTTLLYLDQRIRREALDVELARAARQNDDS